MRCREHGDSACHHIACARYAAQKVWDGMRGIRFGYVHDFPDLADMPSWSELSDDQRNEWTRVMIGVLPEMAAGVTLITAGWVTW